MQCNPMNPTTFTVSNCDASIPMSSHSHIADNKDSGIVD